MRKRVVAASAAFILGQLSAAVYASISVEQIEYYDLNGDGSVSTRYAPVNFGGSSTVELLPGQLGGFFPYITFHAVGASNTTSTNSGHAYQVGRDMYGNESVAYPMVSDVYSDAFDDFLNNNVKTANSTGIAPAPGNFSTGVKVVNTSFALTYGSAAPNTATTDTDALRRIDTMIYNNDVSFVAGAVSSVGNGFTFPLNWSCFNSLAVSGNQTFNPTGLPGKQHADLYFSEDASFGTGTASSYAAALYGNAQAANQTDAMHSVVNRSMLMAGADKFTYTRQTANNLDITHGAGEANYPTSLAILQSGEKPLFNVSSGTVTTAQSSASTSQDGWSFGTINVNGQNAVLFNATNTITAITASLNWNVFSPVTAGNINTLSVQFPNLTLDVVPVTYSSGKYTLGATNKSNTMLHSAVTGDNVQYLYDTTSLPAGTYAFLIGGDSSLSASVGLSYVLNGSFASQWNNTTGGSWNTSSNWTSSIPDGRAAVVNLLASPGITAPGTITLDSDRTVGVINFNNPNGYTIASGTGGQLIFDDNGDSSGTANAQINVTAGNHVISAPIWTPYSLGFNIAGGTSLTLSGSLSLGTATKTGAGNLIFNNTTGSLYTRSINGLLNLSGGTLSLAASSTPATRQLLIAGGGLSMAGTTNNWTSRLDLNNSDLAISNNGDLATITNQVKQGYNNGKWNGNGGILSTAAANDTSHLTALGILLNNQGGSQILTTFDGASPTANSVLIKYTYYGDTNLDGKVDGSDYSRIDNGYLMHLTSWYNGDFNYDGVVNGSDYTLIDNSFNTQGAVIAAAVSTAQIAAVPEPAALGLIAMSSIGLLRRRQKGSRIQFQPS